MAKVGVLCFVLLGFAVVSMVAGSQDNVDDWIQRIRPSMMKIIERKAKLHHHEKPDPTKYMDRHIGIMDVVRMFLKDNGAEFDVQMKDFYNKLADSKQQAELVCPVDTQCPPAPLSAEEQYESYKIAADSLRTEPESCDPCTFLLDNLRDTACTDPWEPFRDNLINLCEEILFPLIGLDPVMCNGTITLQGPHLYCILKEATSFEMCESLNQCYPAVAANAEVPAMSLRTPPVVKERVEKKKLAKKEKKSKKRVRRQGPPAAGTFRIVQLTDIHVQPEYAIGSPVDCRAAVCCLTSSLARDGTAFARDWGEYSCNLPERTLVKFLQRVNDFNPDFVMYAGDSPPHTLWDETQNSQLNVSNLVANAMRNNFNPGTKVYPTIGNHEMFPTNLYSSRLTATLEMTDSFTRMWHDLAGLDAQGNSTFADMSYYSVLHRPGLRILSINTNYDWYTANFYNTLNRNDTKNDEHKLFVETTLANARTNNEKVVIIGHHPIGSTVVRAARWWHEVVMQYSDVIVLHVSGHTHIDEFHLVIDPATDEARSVNLVAPTVTTNTRINPSMRIFEMDDTTFELLNYQCYFFEIDQQNPETEPEIVLNYDAKVDYNMTDVSPASWYDLTIRFLDDDQLFQLWYANRHAMATAGPCALDGVCTDSCKKSQICGIWYPAADEAAACVTNWDNITAPLADFNVMMTGGATSHDVTVVVSLLTAMIAALFVNFL